MDKKFLWRIALIVVVVGLAAWSLYPLSNISYGLDLRGGIHLVIEVQTEDAIKAELDDSAQRLKNAAEQEEIILGEVTVEPEELSYSVAIPAGVDRVALADLVDKGFSHYRISKATDSWTFAFPPNRERDERDRAVRQALETIRNRVDEFGVAEPLIQRQGESDRILIQLPGVDDPQRVKDLISDVAFLEFKEVRDVSPDRAQLIARAGGSIPPDSEILTGESKDSMTGEVTGVEYYLVRKAAIITGRELRTARRGQDQYGMPEVDFSLVSSSADKFAEYTGSHIGTRMAIVLDGKVKSAPSINSRIPGDGRIEGQFTIDEAEDLALVLRAGALPAEIVYLEERTVGPSLGHDSVVRGVRSAVAGLVMVMLFMLVYYRLAGLNANVALMLNIIILMGAMAYFSATLTLPGIAGIILTIGMAVDANVLVFERIREELDVGKTVRSAIDTGFARAFGTILDANITTLVAALFLFRFGTGPIKGFAVTLSIGIIASMFTAVFVSRTIFMLVLAGKDRVQTLSI